MGKIGRKKERIKLNEVLNDRLDSMEDSSALDVFTPKKDINIELMDMVNESLENEAGKKNGMTNTDGSGLGTTIGIVIIFVLFFLFCFFMYNMIF